MRFELRKEAREAIDNRLIPPCDSKATVHILSRATAYIAASMVETDKYSKDVQQHARLVSSLSVHWPTVPLIYP